MKNEQIPYKRIMVGVFFVIFGVIYLLFFPKPDLLLYAVSSLIIIIGAAIFLYSLYEILQYKKTGESKIRIDERAELNSLRASRIGFIAFACSTAAILIAWSFKLMNETTALSLLGASFAVGMGLYVLTYYMYERDEKIKIITSRKDEVYGALEHFSKKSRSESFSVKYSDIKDYLDNHYWRYDPVDKLKSVLNELNKEGRIKYKEQNESTLSVKIIGY